MLPGVDDAIYYIIELFCLFIAINYLLFIYKKRRFYHLSDHEVRKNVIRFNNLS